VKLPRPGPAARAVDGLARPVGEAPAGRHRCGSPPWMAPERVRRQPASPGMDLFALGAVLFELATGTQAFDPADDGPPERRWPQLAGPPPLASSRNTEVPAAVDQAVAALLAPDPADRPASAGQPPPWSVPRWLHDLRRHCRWHTDAPCQNGCDREDFGAPRDRSREQALVGARGGRGRVCELTRCRAPTGALKRLGAEATADPFALGW
jgi:serine/threonine protein kinase